MVANKYFIASSGRSFNGIDHVFKEFNKEHKIPYIGQNGALVIVEGKTIFESNIETDDLKKIFMAFPELSIQPSRIMYEGRDHTYGMGEQTDFFIQQAQNRDPNYYTIENFSDINEPIQKVSIGWDNADQKLLAEELISISKVDGLRATSSGYGSLDVINDGISKAVGLQKLGTYLSIHGEEMAAFGDGENDLEMLYYVENPFIMPNAPDFIKSKFKKEQLALFDNNNSGVQKTIESLIK